MAHPETLTVDIRRPSLENSILRLFGELKPGERMTRAQISEAFGSDYATKARVEQALAKLRGRWLINRELAPQHRKQGRTPGQYWLADNVVLIDVTDLLERNKP